MMLLLRTPRAFRAGVRQIAHVNAQLFNPAIYDTSRYLAWIAALGSTATVPPWSAVAAADMAHRITHYRVAPPRGAGRLLRITEKAAGPDPRAFSKLWVEVIQSRATTPKDWRLPADGSVAKMIERAASLVHLGSEVRATSGTTVYSPGEPFWSRVELAGGRGTAHASTLAGFTSTGDWDATGWLEAFSRLP